MYNRAQNACHYTPRCEISWKFLGELITSAVLIPLSTIIHESGHALAAYLLYNDAKPRITLYSYGYAGGFCDYNSTALSKLGERVGYTNVRALTAAAGPAATMITSIALSRLIPGNGYIHIGLFCNMAYAVSALAEKAFWTKEIEDFEPRHDFLAIKMLKGTFAASTLIIISVALGIFSFYSIFNNVLTCKDYPNR